ncbi:MAG: RNA-binding S4 domain-containing protein [Pseudomonadota bacterium]
MSGAGEERLRLDKWLWRARLYKTRALAAAAVEGGKIRVNSVRRTKPGAGVKRGDVLTIAKAGGVLVLRIEAFGERRGPAAEAQQLYEDLAPRSAGATAARDDATEAKRAAERLDEKTETPPRAGVHDESPGPDRILRSPPSANGAEGG